MCVLIGQMRCQDEAWYSGKPAGCSQQEPELFLIDIYIIAQFIFKEILQCIVKKGINGGTEGGRQGQDDTENIEVFIIWKSASSRILREFLKVSLCRLSLQLH